MGRIKKYKWLLIVLTLSVAFGGVAYAGYNVAIIASSPSDQWHACVSNTGVVRVPTMRLNSYPASCPRSTDTIRSWNASGPSGVNGIDGTDGQDAATGATGPTGDSGLAGQIGATGPAGAPPAVEEAFYGVRAGMTPEGCPDGMYKLYVAQEWIQTGAEFVPREEECSAPTISHDPASSGPDNPYSASLQVTARLSGYPGSASFVRATVLSPELIQMWQSCCAGTDPPSFDTMSWSCHGGLSNVSYSSLLLFTCQVYATSPFSAETARAKITSWLTQRRQFNEVLELRQLASS